jgi:hypothetical protein
MKKLFLTAILFISIATASLAAEISSPNTNLTSLEQQLVAATTMEAAPQFNGARVIGIRPNTPLIYSLAVSGARPVSFSAKNLPHGLKLDSKTGIITSKKPKDLVQAIAGLTKASNLIKSMGKSAEKRANVEFSLQKMVKEQKKIYAILWICNRNV